MDSLHLPLDQCGPFATSVKDAAIVHEVIGGYDPLDSTSIKQTPNSFVNEIDQGVNKLKVGIISELMGGIDGITQEVIDQTNIAVSLAPMQEPRLKVSLPAALYCLSAYYLIAPAEASSNLSRYDGVRYGLRVDDGANLQEMNVNTRTEGFGDEVKRRIMLGTYALSAGYYGTRTMGKHSRYGDS